MKHTSLFIVVTVWSLLLIVACGSEETPGSTPGNMNPPDPDPDPVAAEPNPNAGIGDVRDITSFQLVAEIGPGWNLGNSFDVIDRDKTAWGNPLPTRTAIDVAAQLGFRTLRVPITWNFHQRELAPFEIESQYLDNIEEVVKYGFQNGMHVIINVHHDNNWVVPSAEYAENTNARLASLWTQVGTHFMAYNDSLIFETLNEPRIEGIPEEWNGGTEDGRSFVNQYNKTAVDAIRATGGNNALRHIMVPTWAASTVSQTMDDLEIPNDDPKVIVSLHSYFDWDFAGLAQDTWGTDEDRVALQGELQRIHQKWIVEENRPVILGEWGTIGENEISQRLEYAELYARTAAELGMPTIVWDDGGMFQLLDRRSGFWVHRNIAETIVAASE
jgi:endoglucanase